MVLRRPYAFLIKHFKLFHIILTAITAYLLKSSITVLQFFTSYMTSNEVLYYEDFASQLFSKWMFALPTFMLVIISIVLAVLIRKKKPTLFYFVCIFMTIVTYVLFTISMDTVVQMESEIVGTQKIGLLRDFLTFNIILQGFTILINFIRGIGFDVKKFDFGKDLQELDSTDEDNEEVEVSINVDTNKINRKYRRGKRFFRYNYIEHQLAYNVAFVTVGVLFIGFISYLVFKEDEKFSMGSTFYTENYAVTLNNAYVTSTDYRGNIINEGKRYIVIEAEINTLLDEQVLDPRNVQVVVNDHSLYHINKYAEEFFDLGTVYTGEKLDFNPQTYLFVYELDTYASNMDITFRFAENYQNVKDRLDENHIDINIDVMDLDEIEIIDMEYKEDLIVPITIFKDTKINVSSLAIGNKFKINYRKKIADGEYYDSIEYMVPKIDENYDKGLLKINSTFDINSKNGGISKFTTFMNKFAKISYNFNGEDRSFIFKSHVDSDKVVLKDNYYLEFKKEVLYSTDIYLEFRFRNKIYRYKIDEVEA